MIIIDLILYILLSAISTTYIYTAYRGKDIKIYVSFIIILITFTNIFSIFLLATDIHDTINHSNSSSTNNNNIKNLLPLWYTMYWISYVSSYLIIPLIKSYESAIGFTFKEKAYISLKENILYYGIYLFVVLVLIVYLSIKKELTSDNILAIVTSIGNAFGILIVIMLNGYGLIEIPKSFYKCAFIDNIIEYNLWKAGIINEEITDNTDDLKEFEKVYYN